MAKNRNQMNEIDWGAMTRNNQSKKTPEINKGQVAEPQPAKANNNQGSDKSESQSRIIKTNQNL